MGLGSFEGCQSKKSWNQKILLAKIGADAAENEQIFAKKLQKKLATVKSSVESLGPEVLLVDLVQLAVDLPPELSPLLLRAKRARQLPRNENPTTRRNCLYTKQAFVFTHLKSK